MVTTKFEDIQKCNAIPSPSATFPSPSTSLESSIVGQHPIPPSNITFNSFNDISFISSSSEQQSTKNNDERHSEDSIQCIINLETPNLEDTNPPSAPILRNQLNITQNTNFQSIETQIYSTSPGQERNAQNYIFDLNKHAQTDILEYDNDKENKSE